MSLQQVQTSGILQALGVRKTGDLEFEGLVPLGKPSKNSRGVYGGNLCGQAIMVAMETVDKDFTPHSLHSYFIAAGSDEKVCQYKVETLSTGKNFANRLVRLSQDGQLKYIVIVSLTKRNSIDKTKKTFADTGKGPRPFEFQKPPNKLFGKYNIDELTPYSSHGNTIFEQRLVPEFINYEQDELSKTAGERELAFYIRLRDPNTTAQTKNLKYASMGLITDSLYLTSISRILHLPREKNQILGSSGGANNNFFSVSLDHSIYFHDDDFDPNQWFFFDYKAPRFSNNRVMFTGSYYNEKGKLIASIMQEGLVFFKNDSELKAKL